MVCRSLFRFFVKKLNLDSTKIIDWFILILSTVSPVLASKVIFYIVMDKKLDLNSPKTLNEKIMWLKLNTYKNNPLITQCTDKVKVRDYIKSAGLEHILVPLYNVWDNVNDLCWDDLPDSFVLKCNHGCGYNIICPDKSKLDAQWAKKQLAVWMKTKYWRYRAEINYRHVPQRILSEKYLTMENGESLNDYKVYCFNGQAKYVLVCTGRSENNPKFYFFDNNWELSRINRHSQAADSSFSLPKPAHVDNMFKYAAILSKPFPFVRMDFYITGKDLFFGEMTFTPSAGIDSSRLPETDLMFGEMVNLNNDDCN